MSGADSSLELRNAAWRLPPCCNVPVTVTSDLMENQTGTQPAPSSTSVVRPRLLTALAVILILWGAATSLRFIGFTIEAVSSGRGPARLLVFFVYMHVLWLALVAAGAGLLRGDEWSRWVLAAALLGLLVGTAMQPPALDGSAFIKAVVYPFLVWIPFTKRANAFFAAKQNQRSPEAGERGPAAT